jgi:probable HAF family extracellular repeat protein
MAAETARRYTAAAGINDRGQVVGPALNADNTKTVFVWVGGRTFELVPVPGSASRWRAPSKQHGRSSAAGPAGSGV